MDAEFENLKLDRQLCFPLYACSKEVIKAYRPYLEEIDLTYTQYIVLMVLWEEKFINVKQLGEFLYLDSGTLTPLLKKLEQKGFITRTKSKEDERVINIEITKLGEELKDKAKEIPEKMFACSNLTADEAKTLYGLLYKMLGKSF